MDKCRICLKQRKRLRLITDKENDISYIDMLTSLNLKMHNNNVFPNKLCLLCRRRLTEAYNFKIDVERSEMVLNEAVNMKRINFDNISDVKIEVDCKPVVPVKNDFSVDLIIKDNEEVSYNETIIKKIQDNNNEDQKTQISVNEFLNSVKMESNDDDHVSNDDYNDNDYELEAEYDPASDSDYEYGKPIKTKNKYKKNKKKGKSQSKSRKETKNGIKPVLKQDLKIKHSQAIRKLRPKKKKDNPETNICPYCGKVLPSKSLDMHILLHTSNRPYQCEQCSKSFVSEQRLKAHQKLHSKDRPFKCNQCIASFFDKSLLKSHMLVHSNEKNHICDICNKAFKRKKALARHMDIHKFGKKAIPCELCSMTFHTREFLRHHMRIHTGERPYKCEICSQPYSYKHDFNRHCIKKHGVFLKRRSVKIMNEETLQQERALMKELALRAHGLIKNDDIPSVFSGQQGYQAFLLAMAAAKQMPVSCLDVT